MGAPYSTMPHSKDYPILIVDREGSIGVALTESLRFSFLPLFVSQRTLPSDGGGIHIPYSRSFPRLPDSHFSHIVVVYHGEKEILGKIKSLQKKAKASGAKFLFITSGYFASKKLLEKMQLSYPNTKIIVYGDLFGTSRIDSPRMLPLHQVKKGKKVMLSEMGMVKIFPLTVADLTTFTLETLLGDSRDKVFFAASHERTQLSLMRILQHIDPLITLDFAKKDTRQRYFYQPLHATRLFITPSQLRERLKGYIGDPIPEASYSVVQEEKKSKENPYLKAVIFGMLFFIFLPLIISVLGIGIGVGSVGVSVAALENGNLPVSRTASKVGHVAFVVAEPSEQLITNLMRSLSINPGEQVSSLVLSGQTASHLLLHITDSIGSLENGLKNQNQSSTQPLSFFLKSALIDLQTLKTQPYFSSLYAEQIKKEERTLSLLSSISDVAPSLLGVGEEKRYLVLFQDNMRIRSGGGVIESFALLTMNNGKVEKFVVHDVAEADQKLKGHLEPPHFLKRYKGDEHWLLRESSALLDSTENATSAAKFLALETGEEVDGVISLDSSFLKSLLAITGPIVLPEYNTTIDKMNIATYRDSKRGASAREESGKLFLPILTRRIFDELSKSSYSPLALSRVVTESIAQKHLLATSLDKEVQPILNRNGLTSSPATQTSKDSFGVVENNISFSLSNAFVKRSIRHNILLLEDSAASESVELTYANTSSAGSSEHDYEAYVQLILPKNTTILGMEINGTPQRMFPAVTDSTLYSAKTFKAPRGIEIEESTKYDKKIIGFYWKVVEGEERKMMLHYKVNDAYALSGSTIAYSLDYLKQPGVVVDPYTLSVSYPPAYKAKVYPKGALQRKSKIVVQDNITEDKRYSFVFAAE